jgi:hypothetical protein
MQKVKRKIAMSLPSENRGEGQTEETKNITVEKITSEEMENSVETDSQMH